MQHETVKTAKKKPGQRSRREMRDDSIIGTNDYSIVSKRSVEKLYLHDEPDFLRPFVSKYRRRTPLINRGYWLRMRAIQSVIEQFLDLPYIEGQGRAIVNLGCGYDTLPFRTRYLYPERTRDVLFIDLDYPKLIQRKRAVLEKLRHDELLFDQQNYFLEGCDLRDLISLEETLDEILPDPGCHVLFIAEVSITYMDMAAADNLLAWIPRFKNARLCLHEQIMPEGPLHPFTKTMLAHYEQAGTPLKSIFKYPTIASQTQRLLNAGWKNVDAKDMWSIWQDDSIIQSKERLALDTMEQFDEWEEFVLHSAHYMLLIADMQGHASTLLAATYSHTSLQSDLEMEPICNASGPRRFGAAFHHAGEAIVHFGGMTTVGPSDQETIARDAAKSSSPRFSQDLLCHTATDLGEGNILVAGGRSSPSKASSACWMLMADHWQQVASLPTARFRHSTVPVKSTTGTHALCFGGKGADGTVYDDWLLLSPGSEWLKVHVTGDAPSARFGAALCAQGDCAGVLIGGMSQSGTIIEDGWQWELHLTSSPKLSIKNITASLRAHSHVFRFGATICSVEDRVVLVGGVCAEGILPSSDVVQVIDRKYGVQRLGFENLISEPPLMVGHTAVALQDGRVIIAGGGAVCFSFGSHFNEKIYMLSPRGDITSEIWQARSTSELSRDPPSRGKASQSCTEPISASLALMQHLAGVERVAEVDDTRDIDPCAMIKRSKPVLMHSLNTGSCLLLWTSVYLEEKLHPDRKIVVHTSTSANLSFQTKNFIYETTSIRSFLESASKGEHVYLRSVSTIAPSKTPAALADDFPDIAPDFQVPIPLRNSVNADTIHSSVLRISGDINMWLHYDVMDNILCQIRGSKRVILFPPSDVSLLGFAPGETTATLQVFGDPASTHLQVPIGSHPIEAVLNSGDVLYIPACWPHTTAIAPRSMRDAGFNSAQETKSGGDETCESSLSVAVNVFFRGFDAVAYAAGRDVYGNRDVAAYENGRRDLAKLIQVFGGLKLTREKMPVCVTDETSRKASAEEFGRYRPAQNESEAIATFIATGEKTVRLDDKIYRLADRIRRGFRKLPDNVQSFYLQRLSDELKEAVVKIR